MTLDQVVSVILEPALAHLPLAMDTPRARCMLLAIGLQESSFLHRWQVLNGGGKGPARSFWQFERGGGVKGVMEHPSTAGLIHRICAERDVPFNSLSVWTRMETDDILGAIMARLLLWTDPKPLPALNDPKSSWLYYLRNWRPGKPHPGAWPANHEAARAAVNASATG
jgi:hypothetical protein